MAGELTSQLLSMQARDCFQLSFCQLPVYIVLYCFSPVQWEKLEPKVELQCVSLSLLVFWLPHQPPQLFLKIPNPMVSNLMWIDSHTSPHNYFWNSQPNGVKLDVDWLPHQPPPLLFLSQCCWVWCGSWLTLGCTKLAVAGSSYKLTPPATHVPYTSLSPKYLTFTFGITL